MPSGLSIADLALMSHRIGAERFGVDLAPSVKFSAVTTSLMAIPEVAAAHPRLQRGAPAA